MDRFGYRDHVLHCEEVPIADAVRLFGTPLYLYSKNSLLDHYRKLDESLRGLDHLICYSVKTNGNLAVLNTLREAGSGFDIVSAGELFRVQQAGGDPATVVYAGVGKRPDEMAAALKAGILMFNAESWPELVELNRIAGELGRTARVALRVNPDVDPHTHQHITTGTSENKFGIPLAEAIGFFARARELSHVEMRGLHCHIGSQIVTTEPFRHAAQKMVGLVRALRAADFTITTLNLGGGFGIVYGSEEPPFATEIRDAIVPLVAPLGVKLLLEPGRFIAGNSGVLVTTLLYVKTTAAKTFSIVDAGMNDLIRPALYDAKHAVIGLRDDFPTTTADVVGPICESGDVFLKEAEIPAVPPGECLVLRSAGAYGFSMSSNYNSRPRAAEVLVDGAEFRLVRARESHDDLVRGEQA